LTRKEGQSKTTPTLASISMRKMIDYLRILNKNFDFIEKKLTKKEGQSKTTPTLASISMMKMTDYLKILKKTLTPIYLT
jgi:hypothetical protein